MSFDPLRDFEVDDINTDAGMSATVRELGRISRSGNPDRALALLHHAITGRAGVARAFGIERTSFARNSKVLLAWTRAQINVVPGAEDNNNQLVLTCGKNSNGKEFPPIAVRLNADMIYEVDADFDIEGWREEITATSKRASVKPERLREHLQHGRDYEKKEIVAIIREETGHEKTFSYGLIDKAVSRRILRLNKITKTYALT